MLELPVMLMMKAKHSMAPSMISVQLCLFLFLYLSFTSSAFYSPIGIRKASPLNMGLLDSLFGGLAGGGQTFEAPCVMGEESIMSQKEHGTSATPVQSDLRWDCDRKVADNICNFNRHYAEYRGKLCNEFFMSNESENYFLTSLHLSLFELYQDTGNRPHS